MQLGTKVSREKNIKELLGRYKSEERVVEVQTYLDPETTIMGYVHQVGDEFVCMIELDDDGSYDGVIAFKWDTIFFIRANNIELEEIKRMSLERGDMPAFGVFNLSSNIAIIEEFNDVLGYVVLYLEKVDAEQCYVGTVRIAGEIVLLDEYSPLDEPQISEVMVRSCDVTRIGHGGKYEEALLKRFKKGPKLNVVSTVE